MTTIRQPHEQQPTWQPYSNGPAHFQHGGSTYPAPAGGPFPSSGPQFAPLGHAGSQYGSWGPQQPTYSGPQSPWGHEPPRPKKNAAAMVALVLGIITLCLSPIPILNQAGIIAGFVGVVFGIVGLAIGVRRRHRVAMSVVAVVLCVAGLVAAFAATESFVNSLNSIGSPTAGSAFPAQAVGGTPTAGGAAAPPTYTLSVSGTAKKASVNWSVDGSMGSSDQSTKVPFTRTMKAGSDSFHSVTLSADTIPGTPGDLTCTITDQTGRVLDTKSASSQGGEFGSAMVTCSGFGS